MANTQTEMGRNRTGIATSPQLTDEMLEGHEGISPCGERRRKRHRESSRRICAGR